MTIQTLTEVEFKFDTLFMSYDYGVIDATGHHHI